MAAPLIISFFTDDWEYPQHAERFKADCDSFGLKHYVEQKESTKDYIRNTCMKPFFIRDCLEKFQQPVFWIDIDAVVMKKIDFTIQDYDIAACKYFNEKLKRDWAVASLCFNTTDNSRRFLDNWCENTSIGTDEATFEATWQLLRKEMKMLALPDSYNFVRWSYSLQIPEDTIICHQLSKFEDKMKRKYKGQASE